MKRIQLYYWPTCPYCQEVLQWMQEVRREKPELAQVKVDMINALEKGHEPAPAYYYYVPTFFVDGKKVHEGVGSKQMVETVLRLGLA